MAQQGDEDPDRTAQGHRANGSCLVGSPRVDVQGEDQKDGEGCQGDQGRKPHSPFFLFPQSGAGSDIEEAGDEVEPQHEGHIVPRGGTVRAVDKKNHAAGFERKKSKQDGDQTKDPEYQTVTITVEHFMSLVFQWKEEVAGRRRKGRARRPIQRRP